MWFSLAATSNCTSNKNDTASANINPRVKLYTAKRDKVWHWHWIIDFLFWFVSKLCVQLNVNSCTECDFWNWLIIFHRTNEFTVVEPTGSPYLVEPASSFIIEAVNQRVHSWWTNRFTIPPIVYLPGNARNKNMFCRAIKLQCFDGELVKVNCLHSIRSTFSLKKRQKSGEESSKSYQIKQNMSEMDENADNLHNMGGQTLKCP